MIPATELTKRVCGFKSDPSKENVEVSIELETGILGSYASLDFMLVQNWDIIQDLIEDETATLIKTLKFMEHRDFMMFSIRCHITTTESHCKKMGINDEVLGKIFNLRTLKTLLTKRGSIFGIHRE